MFVLLFLFDFALHFAAEEGSEEAVEEVGDEDDEWHPLVIPDGEEDEEGDDEKLRDGAGGTPGEAFEARVSEFAEHHPGEEDHQDGERPFGFSEDDVFFIDPEEEKGQGSDEPGRGGDGEAGKLFIR